MRIEASWASRCPLLMWAPALEMDLTSSWLEVCADTVLWLIGEWKVRGAEGTRAGPGSVVPRSLSLHSSVQDPGQGGDPHSLPK